MSYNPNTINSQDELNTCNDGKRSSEVLLSTIEELERTKKQLEIAVDTLRCYGNPNNWAKNRFTVFFPSWTIAQENLKKIQELNE